MNLWVLGHEEEAPAKGGGRGLRPGRKQVQRTHDQVLLVKPGGQIPFGLGNSITCNFLIDVIIKYGKINVEA